MNKRAKKRVIIFGIIATILFAVGGFFLGFQSKLLSEYNALKDGESAWADVFFLSGEDYSNPSLSKKYAYVFSVDGKEYASTTVYGYTARQMELIKQNDKILVRYLIKNGNVVLESSDKASVGGKEYPMAQSREQAYFDYSRPPSMTATYFVFSVAIICFLFVALNFGLLVFYKSIDNKGEFAYAVFVEAYSSKFGTNRYMAIRYKYKTSDDKWVEAVSPYTYTALQVDLLKSMEAFGIKYRGKHSIIVESLRQAPVLNSPIR